MQTVVITGGSGFIGTHLIEMLLEKKYSIVNIDLVPSRIKNTNVKNICIDLSKDMLPTEVFLNCVAVINLAGVPIFGRFTKSYKEKIYNSRILTTRKLVDVFSQLENKPTVFISVSAIGYYGDKQGQPVAEDTLPGHDFLSQVCIDWEKEALRAEKIGIRTVIFRNAHILGKGGLVFVLIKLFKKRLGGYFGTGNQHMPWVSVSDVCRMYIYAIENTQVHGIYNTAILNPTQKQFMKEIAQVSGTSVIWRIPIFAARLLYGSFVDSLVSSVFVDSSKIKNTGFTFRDNTINKLFS